MRMSGIGLIGKRGRMGLTATMAVATNEVREEDRGSLHALVKRNFTLRLTWKALPSALWLFPYLTPLWPGVRCEEWCHFL